MGFLDKLLGREEPQQPPYPARQPMGSYGQQPAQPTMSADEQAVARYRYMLQTAPPEQIEQAHEEAFSRLTPEQRQLALQQLSAQTPDNERSTADDPRALARMATRAEMRQPGTMERTFGGQQGNMQGQGGMMGGGMMGGGMMGGMGMGMGGLMAGSLLTSIAGGFIGSSIANSFFNNPAHAQGFAESNPEAATADNFDSDPSTPADAASANAGVDSEGNIDPYGDPANDASDSGGFDSGGFDGGDFGGGDF